MMQEQNALGTKLVNRKPLYDHVRLARVTSVKDFQKYARIEVIFLDYSQPVPVWCFGDLDREPVEGDMVLVGFVEGNKNAPYLHSFYKNGSYTTNFIMVKRDKIKLQLPIFEIGVKDGKSHKDVQEHLLDDSKQNERAYIELSPEKVIVSFPTSEDGSSAPAVIEVASEKLKIYHPGNIEIVANSIKHNGGSKQVARVGDSVEVSVPGVGTCTGTITSGSSKTMID